MNVATSKNAETIGIRDLKNHLSAHLAKVKDGHEVVVTDRGKPVAKLTPVDTDTDQMAELIRAGVVRPPRSNHRSLPEQRVKLSDGLSMDDDVADQRR